MPTVKRTPVAVPKVAIEYLKSKSLKPGFSYLDVWREEHAVAFTVAKVMERRILKDVQRSLVKALEQGVPFEQWAKDIKPTLERSGWADYVTEGQRPRRLRTIYDTNMRVARAVGQWDRVQRTKDTHPYLEYNLGPSEHHREEHAEWEGTVLPADDPWWAIHYPPNGWGCKCWVRQISEQEARELGVDVGPRDEVVAWTNPNTGRVEETAAGIDPGWDMNPGAESVAAREGSAEESDDTGLLRSRLTFDESQHPRDDRGRFGNGGAKKESDQERAERLIQTLHEPKSAVDVAKRNFESAVKYGSDDPDDDREARETSEVLDETTLAQPKMPAGGKPSAKAAADAVREASSLLDEKSAVVKTVDVESLKPTEPTGMQVRAALVREYRRGAYVNPPVINQRGEVVDGHHRLASAIVAGRTRIVVVQANER